MPFPDSIARKTKAWIELVDAQLSRYVGEEDAPPAGLRRAMRYSLFAGGKRLRPLLVLMSADACGGLLDAAMPAACAVEMLHTYSLIHDDLPAMDDDEFRRGQPTCHKKFDEATAILAGDALHTLAFEVLSSIEPPITSVKCARELSVAAGVMGMVGGQMDDLHPRTDVDPLPWIESLHRRKTGALLVASLRMGALTASADEETLRALSHYGETIGLAFQIADDLLDVEGNSERMGKGAQKDDAAGKMTYPGILGVENSRRRARDLVNQGIDSLKVFGSRGEMLRTLATYIVERDH